jgi:hypothetical protein
LVTEGWADTLRSAHADIDELGVIACWHFQAEDFDPGLAGRKTRVFAGRHRIMAGLRIVRAVARAMPVDKT